MTTPNNTGPKLMATTQLKDAFEDVYGQKDWKEGPRNNITRYNILYSKLKDSAASVLKRMQQNRLAAVPIYDAENKKWAGFIDDQLYLQYALNQFFERKESGDGKTPALFTETELKALTDKASRLPSFIENIVAKSNATVGDITNFQGRGAWHPLKWTDTVATAFDLIAQTKCRRVPIIDSETGQVQHIIARTDLMDWFFENINCFHELKMQALKNFPHIKKEVATLHLTARGFDAFNLLNAKSYSGVGVLDQDGKIVAVVKMTDVKRVDGGIAPRLPMNLHDYCVNQEKKRFMIMSMLGAFGGAVNMLQQRAARRIFVFDPTTNKPYGVLSQLDVIEEVARYRASVDAAAKEVSKAAAAAT